MYTRKRKQTNYYNHGTKEMPKLHAGDTVKIRPFGKEKYWTKAQVRDQVDMKWISVLMKSVRKMGVYIEEIANIYDLVRNHFPKSIYPRTPVCSLM